jgi:hypothetical protein
MPLAVIQGVTTITDTPPGDINRRPKSRKQSRRSATHDRQDYLDLRDNLANDLTDEADHRHHRAC